jgi:hypothetical protein
MHYQQLLLVQGSNQFQCNTSSFILSGNAPTAGTGSWSVVSGTATISNTDLCFTGLQVLRRNKYGTAMDHYKWNVL